MKVVVAGSSGLIGTPLVVRLTGAGHQVVRLVRRPARGAEELQWDPSAGVLAPAALAGVDAVINLAGAGIADKRWNLDYKRLLLKSRVDTTSLLARTIAEMGSRPAVFLSGSAIGYYGETGNHSVDETSQQGQGFLADLVASWESATELAEKAGVRVCHLRTGLVLDKNGGLLAKQLAPAKLGLSGRLGSGSQYQSWITLDDELSAILWLLGADVSGPVNLTAPTPVTQADFAKTLGRVLHRPAVAWVPPAAIRLLFGEFADEGILVSQRVVPGVLTRAGFTFAQPELEPALKSVLQ